MKPRTKRIASVGALEIAACGLVFTGDSMDCDYGRGAVQVCAHAPAYLSRPMGDLPAEQGPVTLHGTGTMWLASGVSSVTATSARPMVVGWLSAGESTNSNG